MININANFNQFEYYKNLISNEQPLKRQYVFIVDDEEIRLLIYALGYSAIFLDKNENIDNFIKFTVENSLYINKGINENGTIKADASYVSNFMYLPCLNKYNNEKIINIFKQNYIKVDKNAWKVFTRKGKNLEYYKSNLEDLEKLLDEYINSFVKANNHNFDMKKGKISSKELDMEAFSLYLIEKYKIISIDNSLHYYLEDEKYYPTLSIENFNKIVMKEVYNTTKNKRNEYYQYLKAYVTEKEHSSSNYIMFKNGIYDIKNSILLPFSESMIIITKILHNFKSTFCEETKTKADSLISIWADNDKEIEELLYQVIGYTLFRSNPLGKTFFLQGSGGNGKSTFFDFLGFIINKNNVVHREFEELEKEYNVISLKGKMLTVCDDIDNKYITRVGLLKKIVTGEPIIGKALYIDPEEFRYTGKLLLAGNDVPRINDTSDGLGRRLVIIPFKANLKNRPNINLKEQYFTDDIAEYILYKAIIHLKNVMNSKEFIKPKIVDVALKEYHSYNNPVIEFIEEYKEIINTKACSFVYSSYKDFCVEIGAKSLGRNAFYKKMEEQGYKKTKIRIDNNFHWQFCVF
ncbi:phage/plasmid primase, P4 family [uncultured Tyzzerella sp.]|uniref:DNA primase family protein n=1 Tax=uncultured Tyzzerella sp. TaxID=2321398 RepID=UPI002943B01E|nr:phage/plasmid primase, P4 family [uncultured Tyzzerella sp.]